MANINLAFNDFQLPSLRPLPAPRRKQNTGNARPFKLLHEAPWPNSHHDLQHLLHSPRVAAYSLGPVLQLGL